MTEKTEKPESFIAIYRGGAVHIERNLEFEKDKIQIKVTIKRKDVTKMSLTDLHIASLETAIQHLQGMLAIAAAGKA